jgi:hypothetical protein
VALLAFVVEFFPQQIIAVGGGSGGGGRELGQAPFWHARYPDGGCGAERYTPRGGGVVWRGTWKKYPSETTPTSHYTHILPFFPDARSIAPPVFCGRSLLTICATGGAAGLLQIEHRSR